MIPERCQVLFSGSKEIDAIAAATNTPTSQRCCRAEMPKLILPYVLIIDTSSNQ